MHAIDQTQNAARVQFINDSLKQKHPYAFWFKNNFDFMHLQFKFIKPSKLEFLNFPIPYTLLDHILSFEKLHQYSYETSILTTHCTLTKNIFS